MMFNKLLYGLLILTTGLALTCDQSSTVVTDIPFERMVLENTVARHPKVGDVNDDGRVSALDALLVINYLNRPKRAAGEWLAPIMTLQDVGDSREGWDEAIEEILLEDAFRGRPQLAGCVP